MLDLSEAAVIQWFAPIRPRSHKNVWPPALRPLEQLPQAAALLVEFGEALSKLSEQTPAALAGLLDDESFRGDMRVVLAQLGAARLLRIIEWFMTCRPGEERNLLQLSQTPGQSARALSSAIHTLTARSTLTRMFGPDRLAALQAACVAAADPDGEQQ